MEIIISFVLQPFAFAPWILPRLNLICTSSSFNPLCYLAAHLDHRQPCYALSNRHISFGISSYSCRSSALRRDHLLKLARPSFKRAPDANVA